MARATLSEHWHRVRDLTPRVRVGSVVRAVWSRGDRWHVIGDPVSGRFHRLSSGAYAFVGLLDGVRTVDRAWEIASEREGDHAPTQGEAIAILGQLWTAGVVAMDATPDVRGLLERASKGRKREASGAALSALFPRIPIADPNRLLGWLVGIFGWVFTRWGFIAWCVVVGLGVASLVGQWGRIAERFDTVLHPRSALWAMAAYVVAKLIHEMGHGVACKQMARAEGIRARVPTVGVMVLVGVPSPYVDATAAWGLRARWRRMVVGAAGMYVEVALAAIAAIVWSRVGDGWVSDFAFATMLVAGVSTVVFNANPLLRYDGYYIVSDALEIPNLGKRASDEVWHLVSKWVWSDRRSVSPARDGAEATLLAAYGVASAIYRLGIAWAITAFVWNRVPLVGTAVGLVAFVTMVAFPIGSVVHRILTDDHLSAVRRRAVSTAVSGLVAVICVAGLVPVPHVVTASGVAEGNDRAEVFALAPGVVELGQPSGVMVRAGETIVVRTSNPEVDAEVATWRARADRAEIERVRALSRDANEAEAWASRGEATRARLGEAERLEAGLMIVAPADGVWVGADAVDVTGAWVVRGARVGEVAPVFVTRVRIPIREPAAAAVIRGMRDARVGVRARSASGRGGVVRGAVDRVTESTERDAARPFEVVAMVDGTGLRAGERVVARIELPPSPLLPRWIASVRRALLERDVSPRTR